MAGERTNGHDGFPPMRPVNPDDVREPRKPWWVIGNSRRYALSMGIFYPIIAIVFTVGCFINGRWWNLASAVVWFLLAAAAWPSYFWYRKRAAAVAATSHENGTRRE